jgi:hypothetical protein
MVASCRYDRANIREFDASANPDGGGEDASRVSHRPREFESGAPGGANALDGQGGAANGTDASGGEPHSAGGEAHSGGARGGESNSSGGRGVEPPPEAGLGDSASDSPVCLPGYLSDAGKCEDVDECADPKRCSIASVCRNTAGAFECHCPRFFTEGDDAGACTTRRFEWQLDLPLVMGFSALPYESDLLLVLTFSGAQRILGRNVASRGSNDLLVARLDEQRNVKWFAQYGGPADDVSLWATVDSHGDVILTGRTDGGLNFGGGAFPTNGSRIRFLSKLSGADGSELWSKALYNVDRRADETLSGEREPEWEGFVSADSSDAILLGGRFHDELAFEGGIKLQSAGGWGMFVAKFTGSGATTWARSWGDVGADYVRAVVAAASGEIYVAGTFELGMTFGETTLSAAGDRDVFLGKLSAQGEPLWGRALGGVYEEDCGRLAVDPHGNAIVAGAFVERGSFDGRTTFTAKGGVDAYLAKYGADGEARWARQISGSSVDIIWGVASGPDGEAVVSGYYQESIDFGEGLRRGLGSADAYVAKYDDNGEFVWAYDFGGAGWDTSGNVGVDARGRVYPMGWYQGPAVAGGKHFENSGAYILQLSP